MAIFSYARCELPACGDVVEFEGSEDDLLELGWLTVAYGPGESDRADFCSLVCAAKWLRSAEAVALMTELAEARSVESEEDE